MRSMTKYVWVMMNKQSTMEKKKFPLKTKAEGNLCLSSRRPAASVSKNTILYGSIAFIGAEERKRR